MCVKPTFVVSRGLICKNAGSYCSLGGCFNSLPFQLSDENEQLVKKLKKLHIKNKELEKNLGQIQEKLHLQQLMHDYVTSRE